MHHHQNPTGYLPARERLLSTRTLFMSILAAPRIVLSALVHRRHHAGGHLRKIRMAVITADPEIGESSSSPWSKARRSTFGSDTMHYLAPIHISYIIVPLFALSCMQGIPPCVMSVIPSPDTVYVLTDRRICESSRKVPDALICLQLALASFGQRRPCDSVILSSRRSDGAVFARALEL